MNHECLLYRSIYGTTLRKTIWLPFIPFNDLEIITDETFFRVANVTWDDKRGFILSAEPLFQSLVPARDIEDTIKRYLERGWEKV